jgi:tetratricopeptide (TPR) repeat protein
MAPRPDLGPGLCRAPEPGFASVGPIARRGPRLIPRKTPSRAVWFSSNRSVPRIGRQDIWAALLRRRQRARTGAGGLTLLEGTGGVGKSTFLEAIVDDSRAAGFRVATARASPVDNPAPFTLIGDALVPLRSAKLPVAAPLLAAGPTSSIAFLPALEIDVLPLSADDPLRATEEGGRSELASERYRLMGALAEPFLRAAQTLPLLVALDDVQWADDASIELLHYLLPQLARLPIWIVAASDAAPARGPSGALKLLRERSAVERVVLRPLNDVEVEEFARWAAPHRKFGPLELHRFLVESGGSPGRLMPLIFPPSAPRPRSDGKKTPETDAQLGLGDLSPEARRLLNFAVVAGGEFSLELLASAAGIDEERAVEHVERFVELGFVREIELGRFGFTQEELRFRLYSELLGLRARLYHQRLAEALERTGASDPSTVYALAQHTYLGRLDTLAVQYNRQAAQLAAGSYHPGAALPYLRQALESLKRSTPEDTTTELSLDLDIALQQARSGELADAETSLRQIRGSPRLWKAARPLDKGLLSVYRARVLADLGEWETAEESLREMPPELETGGPVDLRLASRRLRGEILYYRGKYPEALTAHESALALARAAGEPREVAAESVRHATVLSMIPGREEDAIGEFRTALDRLVELGDATEAAYAALCLGAQLVAQARPDEARLALQRAIELAETAHDLRRAGWAYLNLADLEFGQGRLDRSSEHVARARVDLEQVADNLGEARAHLTEGRLALARGELDPAQKAFEHAGSIFRQQNLEADSMEVELRQAELDLARRDEPAARSRLEGLERTGIDRLRPDLLGDWRKLGARLGEPVAGSG